MVTVSRRTPRIIVTPSTIPAAVSSERSRRARNWRKASEPKDRISERAADSTGKQEPAQSLPAAYCLLELRQGLDHAIRRAPLNLPGHPPVPQEDHATGGGRPRPVRGVEGAALPLGLPG